MIEIDRILIKKNIKVSNNFLIISIYNIQLIKYQGIGGNLDLSIGHSNLYSIHDYKQ